MVPSFKSMLTFVGSVILESKGLFCLKRNKRMNYRVTNLFILDEIRTSGTNDLQDG